MKQWCFLLLFVFVIAEAGNAQTNNGRNDFLVADFEDLSLEPGSFWNGSDLSGGYTSGPAFFQNIYNEGFMSWSGFAFSNMGDDTTYGYINQYSAIPAEGYDPFASGGVNYGVAYVQNDWITGEQIPITLDVADPDARGAQGFYITNSTWAALSMQNGDDFAKKFGGESGDDPDWFKLYIWGFIDGVPTDTVEFYLADYRFEDNEDDYIITTWEWVDLSELGTVDSLKFKMGSSDAGMFGINTPTYFCMDNLTFESESSPYISDVLEYLPAPGQLINTFPWGVPSSAGSIIGGINGSLCLGAFGGYVVFRFEDPVENHPDNPYGVDFTIFGNSYQDWSEPGIVSVMKDENGNGLPDDTWYELAGSDHYFSGTIKDYEITYQNPGGPAEDIPWSDNQGNEGFIFTNSIYEQPYYPIQDSFPAIDPESYTLTGSRINHVVDSSGVLVRSFKRAFGYADNTARGIEPYTIPDNPYTDEIENSGGDGFDIDWAVDGMGNYIDLDMIHFVKVHNSVMGDAGYLGELSTEITGAVDVAADPSITGAEKMVVIRDIPPVINTSSYQLEVFAFDRGRFLPGEEITWTTSMSDATVDEGNILTVSSNGEIELTACMASDPSVCSSVTTQVELSSSTSESELHDLTYVIAPNPAGRSIRILGVRNISLSIINTCGFEVDAHSNYSENETLDVSALPGGVYFLRLYLGENVATLKFVKF